MYIGIIKSIIRFTYECVIIVIDFQPPHHNRLFFTSFTSTNCSIL